MDLLQQPVLTRIIINNAERERERERAERRKISHAFIVVVRYLSLGFQMLHLYQNKWANLFVKTKKWHILHTKRQHKPTKLSPLPTANLCIMLPVPVLIQNLSGNCHRLLPAAPWSRRLFVALTQGIVNWDNSKRIPTASPPPLRRSVCSWSRTREEELY